MTARPRRRLAAWHIVREAPAGTQYLALPLMTGGAPWTDDIRLAAPYFSRRDAADSLRVFHRELLNSARIVPVWL